MSYPTNSDDVIDSRDVMEAIEELESMIGTNTAPDDYVMEREQLEALRAFAATGEEFSDWEYGETFIRDSYFEDYARELADDIGAIDKDAGWPTHCIDWEQAARELRMDYTAVDFDGVTYWGRA
jgi:antirestriction protein